MNQRTLNGHRNDMDQWRRQKSQHGWAITWAFQLTELYCHLVNLTFYIGANSSLSTSQLCDQLRSQQDSLRMPQLLQRVVRVKNKLNGSKKVWGIEGSDMANVEHMSDTYPCLCVNWSMSKIKGHYLSRRLLTGGLQVLQHGSSGRLFFEILVPLSFIAQDLDLSII